MHTCMYVHVACLLAPLTVRVEELYVPLWLDGKHEHVCQVWVVGGVQVSRHVEVAHTTVAAQELIGRQQTIISDNGEPIWGRELHVRKLRRVDNAHIRVHTRM